MNRDDIRDLCSGLLIAITVVAAIFLIKSCIFAPEAHEKSMKEIEYKYKLDSMDKAREADSLKLELLKQQACTTNH